MLLKGANKYIPLYERITEKPKGSQRNWDFVTFALSLWRQEGSNIEYLRQAYITSSNPQKPYKIGIFSFTDKETVALWNFAKITP